MRVPLWVKRRIQRDPQQPLSPREIAGLGIGVGYLAVIGLLAFRYVEIWLAPVHQDKALHRKCVLIASEMAKGSDSAYKATYDLCVKGELK
jgi:hypothetical protein